MNKVKEIVKSKQYKQLGITINPELNKYDDVVMFPKKLEEAKETFAKYGIPENLANKSLLKGYKHNFWTTGVLSCLDAKENTYVFVSKTKDNLTENHYTISIIPETLKTLVKDYLGEKIKVHIKPVVQEGNQWLYELIDLRAL